MKEQYTILYAKGGKCEGYINGKATDKLEKYVEEAKSLECNDIVITMNNKTLHFKPQFTSVGNDKRLFDLFSHKPIPVIFNIKY